MNSLAMPMIGGTTTGGTAGRAVLLGAAQQVATVTISSELNLLIVGVVLLPLSSWRRKGLVDLCGDSSSGSTPDGRHTARGAACDKALWRLPGLTEVSLQVHQGECLGLIGPNGSGKTTLINCIAGVLRTDGGSMRFHDTDITTLPAHQRTRLGIARSFQIPKPFTSMTVLENLCIPGLHCAAAGPRH